MNMNCSVIEDFRIRRKFIIASPIQNSNRNSWCYFENKCSISQAERTAHKLFTSILKTFNITVKMIRNQRCRDFMGSTEECGTSRDILFGNPLVCRSDFFCFKKIMYNKKGKIGMKPLMLFVIALDHGLAWVDFI